jgi:hypothetical protein
MGSLVCELLLLSTVLQAAGEYELVYPLLNEGKGSILFVLRDVRC